MSGEDYPTMFQVAEGNDTWAIDQYVIQRDTRTAPSLLFKGAVKFALVAEKLLVERRIRPPPNDFRKGGLKAVLHGTQELKEKKVRGRKVVHLVNKDD